MPTLIHSGLPVDLYRTDDGQFIQLGVTVNGVFFAFGQNKAGTFDADLAEAAKVTPPPPPDSQPTV